MTLIRLQGRIEAGVFLKRLNRFLVEAELDGRLVVAHLPNSGRLATVLVHNATAFLVEQSRIGRKSDYDLFAVEHSGIAIIVDTRFSTVATQTAIEDGQFSLLRGYKVARQNARANNALLDLLLERDAQQFFLEIKCVTHVVNGVAMFPDAPTQRGRKHLKTLINLTKQGFDAGVLFSVQRPDAEKIMPYRQMDPLFAQLLEEAIKNGVKIFTQKLIYKSPNTVEIVSNSPEFSLAYSL